MSRFNNLEFGSSPREESRHELVSDEALHLASADELYWNGRYDSALRAYSRVLEHNAANTRAWCAQVRMLVELDELREARLWVDKALERHPSAPELLAAKAVVLARVGDFGAALAFSDASFEERGDTPQVWLARGEVLLARSDSGAPYCFERAFGLLPSDWTLPWIAARAHAFHRRFALALRHARASAELAPGRAVAWLEAGRAELALGLAARARQSLALARQLDPALAGVAETLAELDREGPVERLLRRLRSLFA